MAPKCLAYRSVRNKSSTSEQAKMEVIAQLVYYIPPPLLPLRLFLDKCFFQFSGNVIPSSHRISARKTPFSLPPTKYTSIGLKIASLDAKIHKWRSKNTLLSTAGGEKINLNLVKKKTG